MLYAHCEGLTPARGEWNASFPPHEPQWSHSHVGQSSASFFLGHDHCHRCQSHAELERFCEHRVPVFARDFRDRNVDAGPPQASRLESMGA